MSEVKIVSNDRQPQTIPTDAALAAEARAELGPLLESACAIFNRLRGHGLIASYNMSPDQYGRVRVNSIDIVRPL